MAAFEKWVRLPAIADFHTHLRDGPMMDLVVPTIRYGGANLVYVMPNLVPPITAVAQALSYKSQLEALEPNVTFLMTLYLHPSLTVDTIREAKRAGISGVKCYPAGLTTNSASGVVDYASFYPIFAEMQRQDLVLNLHGEAPSSATVSILTAEEAFLPILHDIHFAFPNLRIVLEHMTCEKSVTACLSLGKNVTGSITAHHLWMTVDDWANDPVNYCKPVAKTPEDRAALLRAIFQWPDKFFLGTDSAPHTLASKYSLLTRRDGREAKIAAGCFTQPYALALVYEALKIFVEGRGGRDPISVSSSNFWDVMRKFTSQNGRRFYGIPNNVADEEIEICTGGAGQFGDKIEGLKNAKGLEVIPFREGKLLPLVRWVAEDAR